MTEIRGKAVEGVENRIGNHHLGRSRDHRESSFPLSLPLLFDAFAAGLALESWIEDGEEGRVLGGDQRRRSRSTRDPTDMALETREFTTLT